MRRTVIKLFDTLALGALFRRRPICVLSPGL